MNLPDKAVKLLRLAVDGAAPEGEWTTAAVMFVRTLRKDGWTLQAPEPEPEPPAIRQELRRMTMPFGMHKGVEVRELPLEYIEWLLDNVELRGRLAEAIEQEMEVRS